jgi:hypothetical protein
VLAHTRMDVSLVQIFNYLTRLILEGKMLTEEGLVDILTLKDNRPSQSNNYVTALKLYSNAKVILETNHARARWIYGVTNRF